MAGTLGTDDIEDAAGNDMVSFSGLAVTNNTPDPGDTTAPVLSGGYPSGVLTCTADPASIDLEVTTNEPATCRVGSRGAAWEAMSQMTTTGGVTSHSEPLGLSCESSFSYDIICQDTSGNESLPAEIDFSISAQSAIKTIEGCGFSGADID